MTFTWVVYYNTWIGKEASSLFLAHHPYDILKSKQVNILVTYWMKRLFQHWICSRTHRHSLQIFQQFLHNNLVHNLQVTRKFYSKRNNPFSSRNSVFLFKRPMQKKKKTKIKTFDFKSANSAIFAVFNTRMYNSQRYFPQK